MSELKLAISNIAWDKADDEAVYAAMQQNGFTGLEIAPTRIFPEYPYENLTGAALFGGYLLNRWGFHVPSMQSIWYGQTGNIFDPVQAEELLDYTAEAFQFAHTINCPVWCSAAPKPPPGPAAHRGGGRCLFAKAGALASHYDVVLAIEANPPVYTNYLNNTADAFAMVKRLQSPGLAVNLDLSTMISNGERLRDFVDDIKYVSHVHISEPGLEPIVPRQEHKELAMLLKAVGYSGDVSIEMKRTDVETVRKTLAYIAEVFA